MLVGHRSPCTQSSFCESFSDVYTPLDYVRPSLSWSPVFHDSHLSVVLRTSTPHVPGGQKIDKFVCRYSSNTGGEEPKDEQVEVKCQSFTSDTCAERLRETPLQIQCPNVPEPVRKEALQWLAAKRGDLPFTSIDKFFGGASEKVAHFFPICQPAAHFQPQQSPPELPPASG